MRALKDNRRPPTHLPTHLVTSTCALTTQLYLQSKEAAKLERDPLFPFLSPNLIPPIANCTVLI